MLGTAKTRESGGRSRPRAAAAPPGGGLGLRDVRVRVADFKVNARRLLPASHPLLKVLAATPDEMSPIELSIRLEGWLALLED